MPSLMSQRTNVVIFKNWRCVTTLCDNSVWDVDYITYNPPASAIVCHLPPIEDMPCLVPPLLRTYAICIEHPDQALVIISGQSKKSQNVRRDNQEADRSTEAFIRRAGDHKATDLESKFSEPWNEEPEEPYSDNGTSDSDDSEVCVLIIPWQTYAY